MAADQRETKRVADDRATPCNGSRARRCRRLHDTARNIVDRVLSAKRPGDVLLVGKEIGFPLPYTITTQLRGVPATDDLERMHTHTAKSISLVDAFLTSEQIKDFTHASRELC